MRVLNIPYATWKSLVTSAMWPSWYTQGNKSDRIIAYSGTAETPVKAVVWGADHADWLSSFPGAALAVDEDDALAFVIQSQFGENFGPRYTSDKVLKVSPWPTEGSRTTKISHRWNDPTTWIHDSVQATEQACAADVAGTSYDMPHQNIIDVRHGKLWEEEGFEATHSVLVEIDEGGGWTSKTENDPHTGVGDYTLNYATGKITFSPVIDPGASVRASYWYESGSTFLLKPDAGKRLLINAAEVQFSADVELNDTVMFETYGYVDVFAPQLLDTADPPGPYPSGTLIPIRKTVYKSLPQFIDESNGAYPTIPSIGSNWRGASQPVTVFPWNYAAALPLSSAAGMEVRIYLEHGTAFGGSYVTAAFYCLSEDE